MSKGRITNPITSTHLSARAKGRGRFVGNTPDNHIVDKQGLLPPKGFEPILTNTHFPSLNAKLIDNTAVVFGNMVTTGDPTALRFAVVYTKRAGTWKMIAAQMMPAPATKGGGEQ